MGDSSASSYIRLVQHLIEKCLLFNMTKEECMEALSKHADITPVIKSTVWRELEKENKDFFEGYLRNRENSCTVEAMEMKLREMMIQNVITSESSTGKDSQDSKTS